VRRRALLALVGASATAGCSTVSGLFDDERHAGLGGLAVVNFDDEPHTVTVRVEADDELVSERSVAVDSFRATSELTHQLRCSWRETTGPYLVRARTEATDEWFDLDLDGAVDPNRVVTVTALVPDYEYRTRVEFAVSTAEVEDCRTDDTDTSRDTPKENAF
jgi:hypothetical protein